MFTEFHKLLATSFTFACSSLVAFWYLWMAASSASLPPNVSFARGSGDGISMAPWFQDPPSKATWWTALRSCTSCA